MSDSPIDKSKVNPGIHKHFDIGKFDLKEKLILDRLSKEWYLTNSGQEFTLGASKFRYFLMKPTSLFSELFNLDL